jgi:hypothetical protein
VHCRRLTDCPKPWCLPSLLERHSFHMACQMQSWCVCWHRANATMAQWHCAFNGAMFSYAVISNLVCGKHQQMQACLVSSSTSQSERCAGGLAAAGHTVRQWISCMITSTVAGFPSCAAALCASVMPCCVLLCPCCCCSQECPYDDSEGEVGCIASDTYVSCLPHCPCTGRCHAYVSGTGDTALHGMQSKSADKIVSTNLRHDFSVRGECSYRLWLQQPRALVAA